MPWITVVSASVPTMRYPAFPDQTTPLRLSSAISASQYRSGYGDTIRNSPCQRQPRRIMVSDRRLHRETTTSLRRAQATVPPWGHVEEVIVRTETVRCLRLPAA